MRRHDIEGKSVLVTGGAGFIGSHLVEALLNHNPKRVVIVDNFFLGSTENLPPRFESKNVLLYSEDAGDLASMQYIMDREKIDVVYDLAVKPLPYSFVNPVGAYMTSVKIADTLASLLLRKTYKTLIHFSSSEVYGSAKYIPMDEAHPVSPETPYAAGKASADLLLLSYNKTFDLDIRILRSFNCYGPRGNRGDYAAVIPFTIDRVLGGEKPMVDGDGRQTRDFIYVTDVIEAAISLYDAPRSKGLVMNVGTGKETEIGRLVGMITDALGAKGEPTHGPERPADVQRHCANVSLARKLIGFRPKVQLKEGLARTIEWHRKNPRTPFRRIARWGDSGSKARS